MKVQRESEQLHGGHAPTHGHPRTRRHERFHSCCPAAVLPVSSAGPIGSRQLAVQPIADVQRGGRASDEAGGENPERRPLRARQHHQHRRFDPRPLQSDRRAGDEEDKPGNPRPPRPQRAVRTVHRGHVCEPYAGGRPAVPGAAGRFVSQTGGTGGPECRTERPGDPHQPDEGRGSAEQRLFRSEQPGLDFESPWQLRRPGGGPPDAVPAARVLSRPDPQPQKHGQKTDGSWDALSPAHCRFRAASMIQGRNFIDCGVVDTVYLIIITS